MRKPPFWEGDNYFWGRREMKIGNFIDEVTEIWIIEHISLHNLHFGNRYTSVSPYFTSRYYFTASKP